MGFIIFVTIVGQNFAQRVNVVADNSTDALVAVLHDMGAERIVGLSIVSEDVDFGPNTDYLDVRAETSPLPYGYGESHRAYVDPEWNVMTRAESMACDR